MMCFKDWTYCFQVQALDEAWQAERVGLKDKLERLQKVSFPRS